MSQLALPNVPVTEVPTAGGGCFPVTAHIDGLPPLQITIAPQTSTPRT